MSKTALLDAIRALDVECVRDVLAPRPDLKAFRTANGLDLLQQVASRGTAGDAAAAGRQLRLAKWLVANGFDPRAMPTTPPGEDGEADPARVSLVWFAVAKARNNKLARYFLEQGAAPGALYAAAWWGNADIIPLLVQHGADLNEVVGATPLHMAVDLRARGIARHPELARQRLKVVSEMLRLGGDPNTAAFDGTTPLHIALHRGFPDVFTLLLMHGANPELAGKDGRTVRQIAARKKDPRYHQAITALSRLRSL